ncbi:mitochondrial coenzyme A transporter SLC25A42 [Cyclospora cayetanensis]|uniref:Mitochondrial coenzyme A transporter SLC25A42 n=1 Tax=Cyclospora cayetanensis TaxID=88456 RepID=A0A6P6S0N7_9EIME|nr:mitochondrial coenzyme A transporter SLC25A42 [Cyclospora cayetanensis]
MGRSLEAEKEEGAPKVFLAVPRLTASLKCTLCHFLRGSIAGATAKTIVHPLDRVKMRLQMIRNEGFFSLWKGNSSAFCRTFPHSGIVYFSFDRYLAALQRLSPEGAKANRLLAGAAAGATSTVVTYPLDVLNTRMSVTKHRLSYHQVSMLRHEGAASLYRGFLPTILGIVPYASVSFFTFETLKQRFLVSRKYEARGEEFTTLHSVVCGGFAGALGQTLTYPLDSVRKLMQANAFLHKYSEKGALCDRRLTTLDAFRQIYRRGGVRGLYKGASLCWVKGFSAAGISFSLNERYAGLAGRMRLEGSVLATCHAFPPCAHSGGPPPRALAEKLKLHLNTRKSTPHRIASSYELTVSNATVAATRFARGSATTPQYDAAPAPASSTCCSCTAQSKVSVDARIHACQLRKGKTAKRRASRHTTRKNARGAHTDPRLAKGAVKVSAAAPNSGLTAQLPSRCQIVHTEKVHLKSLR